MGWTSGYSSIKQIQNEFLKLDGHLEIIGHKSTCFGQHLWIAYKYKDKPESFIVLIKIEKFEDNTWGYKDMDESCHPYIYDCPLELLNKTTGINNTHSINWRNEVKEYHAKMKNGLIAGEIIKLYGRTYRVIGKTSERAVFKKKSKSYDVVCLENGREYKLTPKHFKKIEKVPNSMDFIQG